MTDKTISLVCVYNDKHEFESMVGTLDGICEAIRIEIVGIDNRGSRFTSAAAALNYGANLASGSILIFLHQDIRFLSDSFFDRLLSNDPNNFNRILGVAGVASCKKTAKTISNMREGLSISYDTLNSALEAVVTLDECFLACSLDAFKAVGGFDAKTCPGWHLYVADFCLAASRMGIVPYVIDSHDLLHMSRGAKDASFYVCERLLAEKYSGVYPEIATTCTWFPTGWRYTIHDVWRKTKKFAKSTCLSVFNMKDVDNK